MARDYELPGGPKFVEKEALFYMKYNLSTNRTRIFVSEELGEANRFLQYSEDRRRGRDIDPFGFLCCAVAGVFEDFTLGNYFLERFIRRTVTSNGP